MYLSGYEWRFPFEQSAKVRCMERQESAPPAGQLGLLQAVSVNMAMMVGVGPFITMPLFVSKMGGPHSLVVWLIAAIVAICDGMVWAELAGAFPGAGGTLHFYDQAYGQKTVGRMMKFLFVWQFLFSAPLELASGALGFALYLGYLMPEIKQTVTLWPWEIRVENLVAMCTMVGIVALAWRNIQAAGRLMVILWVGMLFTVGMLIFGCAIKADMGLLSTATQQLGDAVSAATTGDYRLWVGIGAAMAIAMYDFLGYYQVCYLGNEVKQPERTLPRSILIAVLVIAALYFCMNLSLFAVMPWQDVAKSEHIASDAFEKLYGGWAGKLMTGLILWTALAATYAAMLGYSRVPYAAARTGHFFSIFGKLHPRGQFPHYALLFLGAIGALACLRNLDDVIAALLTSRILIQFLGQIVTVFYIRRSPELKSRMKFRMPLFPLPAIIAFVGWSAVFLTSDTAPLLYGGVSLVVGVGAFIVWNANQPAIKA
jgi:amino acid transporter